MKDIIIAIFAISFGFLMIIIVINEERKLEDKRLKNELKKTKIIIEELKK